jgi:hypothetical protein
LLATVTLYADPLTSGMANVKAPLLPTTNVSPPLSAKLSEPINPDTVPPTVLVLVTQVTATLVTLLDGIDPPPLMTVHCWLAGFATTVTLYAAPVANEVAKVNAPLAANTLLSPLLFASVIEPFSPDTVPPTVYFVGVGSGGCGTFGSPFGLHALSTDVITSGAKSRDAAPKRLVRESNDKSF